MVIFKPLIDLEADAKQKNTQTIDRIGSFADYLQAQSTVFDQLAKADKEFSDSLGWLDIEEWASEPLINQLLTVAADIRSKADVFVLIGVGGSNNAARSVIEALQEDGPKILYAGNTLSPSAIQKLFKQLDGQSVYIHCIAKNFETLEPGSSFRLLRQYLNTRYGDSASERISVTGSPDSSLEILCKTQAYQFFTFPTTVGGRFTAITTVGLLPMAVAGIDIQALVAGARQQSQQLKMQMDADNPAYRYACYRNYLYQAGYQVELLASFEPQLHWFNKWWLQLFAESEGKDGKGLLPTYAEYSEDLHAVGQFVQDGSPILLETFIHVKQTQASVIFPSGDIDDGFDYLNGQDFASINQEAYQATIEAHLLTTPIGVIEIDQLNANSFGKLFYFFHYACYLSALILGVNPFDQPGVEAYKERMFKRLKHTK